MSKNDDYINVNAKIRMKKSALDGLGTGELKSNNGIRNNEGHLDSFVDVLEINGTEEDERDYYISQLEGLAYQKALAEEQDDSDVEEAAEFIGNIVAGLVALTIFLSNKDNREAIKNAWNGIVVPKAKGLAERIHKIKWFKPKQVAKTNLVAIDRHDIKETEQKNEKMKQIISSEEFKHKLEDIKKLAILLAIKIEDVQNFEPSDDMTQEEFLEYRDTVKELTKKETLGFIENLISNNDILNLDEITIAKYKKFVSEHREQLEMADKIMQE